MAPWSGISLVDDDFHEEAGPSHHHLFVVQWYMFYLNSVQMFSLIQVELRYGSCHQ